MYNLTLERPVPPPRARASAQVVGLFADLDKHELGSVSVEQFINGLQAMGLTDLTIGEFKLLYEDCDANGLVREYPIK